MWLKKVWSNHRQIKKETPFVSGRTTEQEVVAARRWKRMNKVNRFSRETRKDWTSDDPISRRFCVVKKEFSVKVELEIPVKFPSISWRVQVSVLNRIELNVRYWITGRDNTDCEIRDSENVYALNNREDIDRRNQQNLFPL